jgi:peptide/nickel transport system permease protein
VSLLVVVTLAFGLVYLMPGDPALTILGPFADKAKIAQVHEQLGTNKPFGTRYVDYIENLVHGDLGTSFFSNRPVTTELWKYLPNTVELVVCSLLFASLFGIFVGTVSAYFRGRLPDRIGRTITTLMQSTPDFFLGLLFIYTIFFLAGAAPAPVGRVSITDQSLPHVTGFLLFDTFFTGHFALFWDALQHIFLPTITLGLVYSAYFAKTTRTSMSAALRSPQVEFARACGLPERKVLRYAFLAARTPILTYGAILFGALLGGEAIVETIYSWEGIGQWALTAILNVDVPVIQGFILTAGVATLFIYLLLDLLVLRLDPRVSYG